VPAPPGTGSVLFADIEGSRLRQSAPEAMRLGLARYCEIVRSAVEALSGPLLVGDVELDRLEREDLAVHEGSNPLELRRELGIGGEVLRVAVRTCWAKISAVVAVGLLAVGALGCSHPVKMQGTIGLRLLSQAGPRAGSETLFLATSVAQLLGNHLGYDCSLGCWPGVQDVPGQLYIATVVDLHLGCHSLRRVATSVSGDVLTLRMTRGGCPTVRGVDYPRPNLLLFGAPLTRLPAGPTLTVSVVFDGDQANRVSSSIVITQPR